MSSLEWSRDGMSIDSVVSARNAGFGVAVELADAAVVEDFDIVSSDIRDLYTGGQNGLNAAVMSTAQEAAFVAATEAQLRIVLPTIPKGTFESMGVAEPVAA